MQLPVIILEPVTDLPTGEGFSFWNFEYFWPKINLGCSIIDYLACHHFANRSRKIGQHVQKGEEQFGYKVQHVMLVRWKIAVLMQVVHKHDASCI